MELLIGPLRLCGRVWMAWKRAVGLLTGVQLHYGSLCLQLRQSSVHPSAPRPWFTYKQHHPKPFCLGLCHKSKHRWLFIFYCIIHEHEKLIYRQATIWQALVCVLFDSDCSCSIHFFSKSCNLSVSPQSRCTIFPKYQWWTKCSDPSLSSCSMIKYTRSRVKLLYERAVWYAADPLLSVWCVATWKLWMICVFRSIWLHFLAIFAHGINVYSVNINILNQYKTILWL